MENLFRDFRYGLRGLNKDRRFALLAIFALALGIGATTIVFSVIYNGLLHPFPYKGGDRLANFYIHDVSQSGPGGRSGYAMSELVEFREQNHVFEDIMGCDQRDALYTTAEGTQQFNGVSVTENTFVFLDVKPLLGRMITPEDAKPGAAPVVAMNYRVWRTQFNANPNIVGTTLTLNGVQRTLVAVMPRRFGLCAGEVWMPVRWSHTAPSQSDLIGEAEEEYFWAIARLKPGVSEKSAAADLDVIAQQRTKSYP